MRKIISCASTRRKISLHWRCIVTDFVRDILENQLALYTAELEKNLKIAMENTGPKGDFWVMFDAVQIAAGLVKTIDEIKGQLRRPSLLDAAEAMCPGA